MDMRQKSNQTYGHKTTNRHMDSQTNKPTKGVYFGMSDKPYFDPYIFGKLHLKIHNTVR